MNFTIDNLRIIEEEYVSDFEFKTSLTEVELYGLEHLFAQLLTDWNNELGIDSSVNTFEFVNKYTVHREDCLDVLDGYQDVITVGDYAVSSLYLTKNSIPVFKCFDLDEDLNPIENTEYYISIG